MARFADATPDVAVEDPGLAGDLQSAPAARSLETLRKELGAIVDQHGGSGLKFNVALDEPGNIIVLYVTDVSELEGARKSGRLKLPGYVRIQQVPSLVEPTATA